MNGAVTLESLGFTDGWRTDKPALGQQIATRSRSGGKLPCGRSTSVEERALSLLGAGVAAESVASALGVTGGYISQLLADDVFATQVATLRYENLQKHNLRDDSYDDIEDRLLEKLSASLGLMFKPETLLKAISVVNAAKRRGQATPEQVVNNQTVVQLVLPAVIAQRFSVNINNQVTRAGDQELHTIPSSNLLKQVEDRREMRENLLDNNGEVSLDI